MDFAERLLESVAQRTAKRVRNNDSAILAVREGIAVLLPLLRAGEECSIKLSGMHSISMFVLHGKDFAKYEEAEQVLAWDAAKQKALEP